MIVRSHLLGIPEGRVSIKRSPTRTMETSRKTKKSQQIETRKKLKAADL